MTVFYGTQSTKVLGPAPSTPSPGFVDGNVRCFAETVTLASQATTDTVVVCRLPKGAIFLGGILNSTVSLGSATISIGHTGSLAKYRAAAAFTAVDTPTFFGPAAAVAAEAAERTVFLTIAAAALPASGTLSVTMLYATN